MDVCSNVPPWADEEPCPSITFQMIGTSVSSPNHTFICIRWPTPPRYQAQKDGEEDASLVNQRFQAAA